MPTPRSFDASRGRRPNALEAETRDQSLTPTTCIAETFQFDVTCEQN